MADTAKKVKFNIWVFSCYTLSVAFSYACYFVYAYLPLSEEFTNSIEYSGQETVAAFGSSFAAGILSAVIFIVMAFVFRKYFYRLSESDSKIGKRKIKGAALEWIALVSSVLLFAVLIVSAVLSFLYFKKCNDMRYPFLAPTDGTIFKTYEYVILANTIVHTVFYVLTVIKMAGLHWLDAIAGFIENTIEKRKNKK